MSLTQEVQAKNQSILQTPDHDRDSYIEDADHHRRNNAQHHNLVHGQVLRRLRRKIAVTGI